MSITVALNLSEVNMLKGRRRISVLTFLVFTAYMLALAGCGNDNVTGLQGDPPDIPPTTTFLMSFGDFTGAEPPAQASDGDANGVFGATAQNWSYAALNVLVWNTVLTVGLAVPAASFIAAFGHQPVRHTNGDWVWSYNFYVNEVLHLAELHGRVDGDDVTWEMYISKEDAFTDFLWYSGVSDIEATEGSWTIYDNPDDAEPLIRIDWHRNPDEGTADITYTNIIPGDAENGGYISYGITGNVPYDAFYDIYNKGDDNHTNIEWHRTTNAGRVQDEDHFGDSTWHCWDGQLQDVDCP